MSCKFRVYERISLSESALKTFDFTCDEIREKKDELLKRFREIYGSGTADEHKSSLENFLKQCKCRKRNDG